MRKSPILAALLGAALAAPAGAFEIRTGFDVINDPQTEIEGFHRLFIGREIAPGLSFGQSLYSAAMGDAGGAFLWGFEMEKAVPLGRGFGLAFSGFVGGGGGAAQIVGDGLMLRAGVDLSYDLSDRVALSLGGSWIKIEGAEIDDPALSLGLRFHAGREAGATGGLALPLRAVAIRATQVAVSDHPNRAGRPQADLSLAGAEARFALAPMTDLVLGADGAAKGGEGYMQVIGGLRQRWAVGPVELFAEGTAGFGGGGEVDTGAGALLGAAAGIALPLAPWADLEFALGATAAPDSDYRGAVGSLRLVRVFERAGAPVDATPPQWQFSMGLAMQDPNANFRNPGNPATARPIMQESSVDLFLTDALYLTGNAQTAMGGDAAGYAIGMLGLGYRLPLGDRWAVSVEGHLGAAGGGGIDTNGGLIGSLRTEVDYALTDRLSLSVGVGKLGALKGDAMAPTFVQAGLKIPFTAP